MFDIIEENVSMQGIEYDYQSVMQFHTRAFSRNNLRTVVLLKYRRQRACSAQYPSPLDIRHLHILYCGGMYMYLKCGGR